MKNSEVLKKTKERLWNGSNDRVSNDSRYMCTAAGYVFCSEKSSDKQREEIANMIRASIGGHCAFEQYFNELNGYPSDWDTYSYYTTLYIQALRHAHLDKLIAKCEEEEKATLPKSSDFLAQAYALLWNGIYTPKQGEAWTKYMCHCISYIKGIPPDMKLSLITAVVTKLNGHSTYEGYIKSILGEEATRQLSEKIMQTGRFHVLRELIAEYQARGD